MRNISSGLTIVPKRLLPAICLTVIGAVSLFGLLHGKLRTPSFFIWPAAALGAICAYWYFLLSELADEITDHGAYLLVRLGAIADKIPLADIKDVESGTSSRWRVMTLRLVHPGKFGLSISFLPFDGLPFANFGKEGLKEELLRRADAARRAPPHLARNHPNPALAQA